MNIELHDCTLLKSITTIGDSSIRFDWAHPVGDYNDLSNGSNTFYVQLLQTF